MYISRARHSKLYEILNVHKKEKNRVLVYKFFPLASINIFRLGSLKALKLELSFTNIAILDIVSYALLSTFTQLLFTRPGIYCSKQFLK